MLLFLFSLGIPSSLAVSIPNASRHPLETRQRAGLVLFAFCFNSLLKPQPQAHVVPITENLCNAVRIWMGIGWPLYFNTASLFQWELTVSSHFSDLRCFCFTTKFLKSKGGRGEQAAGSMHWGPGLGHLEHSSSPEKATFGLYVSASQGIQKADVPEHSLGWVNYP